MSMAYFSPNPGFLRRLAHVAERGRATILTASKSDNNVTIDAARHCYHRLLRSGVEIHEYGRQRLHAKLIVIDDITYIGSANFDMRSLRSEEHTSELQSLMRISYAVFCLKKKKIKTR